jgi:putative ABC transport system permease protein
MTLIQVGFRNVRRAPLRTFATIVAVAIGLLGYLLLRSINAAWTERISQTPNDRVITRDKIGWTQKLPSHYAAEIRQLPGIVDAVGVLSLNLELPQNERARFQANAVEAEPFIAIHHELEMSEDHERAFLTDRGSALISVQLAKELHWSVGDTLHLRDRNSRRELHPTVAGVYLSTRHGFAERMIWLHWEYINESLPPDERDKMSLVSARVNVPSDAASLAKAIDIHFDGKPQQTFSQDDQASNAAFVGRFAAILDVVNVVSVLVLGVVLLILGNTLALGARERTREYAVLLAIGFSPKQLALLVFSEAGALGIAGGILAVLLSGGLAEGWLSRYLESRAAFVPLHTSLPTAVAAVALGGVLAVVAAALPTRYALRLDVVDSLRRIN